MPGAGGCLVPLFIRFSGQGSINASDVIIKLITLGHVSADEAWSRYGLYRSWRVQADRAVCGKGHGRYDRYEPVKRGDTVFFLPTRRGLDGGAKGGPAPNPRGARPSDKIQEQVDKIRAGTEKEHGYVPKELPKHNSTPMRIEGTRKLVTPKMLNQACALVLLFFTSLFMYVQFYCAWWWFEEKGGNAWITRECDHLVPYGWGVRSALKFQDGSGGTSGNLLSYFKAFQWMNDFGIMNELDALMPQKGIDAIAAALEYDIDKLPEDLSKSMLKLPLIPDMFAVAFCGVLCYLPVLHVICCCGNRCKMVCDFLGYKEGEKDVICSDKIWVSRPVHDNTYFFKMSGEASDELFECGPRKAKFLHTWYMPLYSTEHNDQYRFVAFQFYHPEQQLGGTRDVTRLHALLAGAANDGKLPIKADMINLILATLATKGSYDVAAGKQCGTSTCRGGVLCVRAEQKKRGLLRMVNGREKLYRPRVDLFKGMADDKITKLVADWQDFHAWRGEHVRFQNLQLFLVVLKKGLFKKSAFGKKGDVLGKLLKDAGNSRYKISPDIAKHIAKRPWKGASKNAAKNATAKIEELTKAYVDSIQEDAKSAWDWWMKSPGDGLACRADLFKWWHWIGNKHKVSAREWAEEGPHQRRFDEEYSFDEERPITIFSEDNGDEIAQPDDDDDDAGDAPAAAPIDLVAVEAKVAELVNGFPKWFVRGDSYRAERGDRGWSCRDEAVGKVVVRPNYVSVGRSHGTIAVRPEKTYTVCVAVRHVQDTSPFGSGTLVREFRVLYGVRRRYPCGTYMREAFDDIDEAAFKKALPQSDLDVATAEALREALDARPAAPPSSGAAAPAPAEHPKLVALRREIASYGTDPAPLLVGWTVDETKTNGFHFVHPVTGFLYNRSRILRLLDVDVAAKSRKSRRETRTPKKAQDDEDKRFAPEESCVRRHGLKCISCDFEGKDHDDLISHRADKHKDERADQRPPGEPCGRCRSSLLPPLGTWVPGCGAPLYEPGDAGPPLCQNASAGRAAAFAIEQEMNRRRVAEHRADTRPRPPAPAPSRKRAKKSDKTTKR